ncbi:MAG: gamma carbonic anhydrase family protein [Bacteroidales bacterium]|nr:gamma carbonic anhydrase family protein [Bacteroidales bacterium]
MAIIKTILGKTPAFGKDCFLAENSAIIGDVVMGDHCSVWYSCVIRGDVNTIRIGNNSNIQDCSCIHATYKTGPVEIGNNVTIGHNVTVHACTIDDGALIGMGSTLLDGCKIGKGAVVAAGALVLQNTVIGDGELWGGVPAKFIKKAKTGQAESFAEHYVMYKEWYK